MKTSYYINGVGLISPQRTFNNEEFLPEIATYDKNVLSCVVPDFKAYINPIQLRRLNRMLRIGLSASTICLRDAHPNTMDGIVTATGYGFLSDTAVFMNEMLSQHEQHVAPTHFMQSTYNALGGLVALSIQCKGYNNTYVSKGFAFENALDDVLLQLNENPRQHFLIGAFDEAAQSQLNTHTRLGYFKQQQVSSMSLFEQQSAGTLQGEGAAFFCISGERSESTWCTLHDIHTLYKPASEAELFAETDRFLLRHGLSYSNIDLLISGENGDPGNDRLLQALARQKLAQVARARFKHLCGEYCTATSFALWLAASILKKQTVPAVLSATPVPQKVSTILVANQYLGNNYSLMLLSRAMP
jgi:3-oxoacyl-[acyl-carrier-protein] synthase II